ncbi:MAG: glycosyltransferase family 4 protein [Bryobacteraceae bacterium]
MAANLRLIAIGFYTPGTGLTRVMDSILRRLADCYEIHYLGIGYAGETVRDRGLTIYPTNPKGGDVFAAFQARRLIEETHPHLVLILHDIWMFQHYLRVLGPCRDPLKIVAYIPLDGLIVDERAAAPLRQADSVVVYTEYARQEVESAFRRLGGEGFPTVEAIPHAVDCDRFFPYPELVEACFDSAGRAPAKRRLLGDLPGAVADSFVVLNPNRPDRRKRIDLTLAGFAQFAAGKPDNVRLCLHHAFMSEREAEQIPALIRGLGIENRVHLNPLGAGVRDDGELNLLYNACDVGINTSMGEGWGLLSMEHGAAGGAQIVPDHTACAELWLGRGEMIPVAKRYVPEFSVLEMGEVSPEGVASALESLYRNRERRRKLSQAAFTMTQNPAWRWDQIARRFDELFRRLAG